MITRIALGQKPRRLAGLLVATGLVGSLFVAGLAANAAGQQPAASLDQCRNGGTSSKGVVNSIDCVDGAWVNGNAGRSNAHYVEGYSISYRARLTNLPANTLVTIVFGYDIKHSGTNAIDFLTSNDWNDEPDHNFSFGHDAEAIDAATGFITGSPELAIIPKPELSGGENLNTAAEATFDHIATVGGDKMKLWGGTFGSGPITYPTLGDLTASSSETQISISFTTDGDGGDALLSWGGHIAKGADWGTGAAGISGSPYHMRLKSWNLNSLGNQDRSLSADAVISPTKLIIAKATIPAGNTDDSFTFTPTNWNSGTTFPLKDTEAFSSPFLAPGTYGASEAAKTGWTLSNIVCTGATASTVLIGGTSAFVAGDTSVSVTLAAGEIVTCTFTNTKLGSLTIIKDTVPNDGTDFTFTKSGTGFTGTFILDDDSDGTRSNSEAFSNISNGVARTVTESANTNYNLSNIVCTGATASTVLIGGTSAFVAGDTSVTVTLANGEDVTCTFTNTALYRAIVLVCNQGTLDLYASDVTLGSVTRTTRSVGNLPALSDYSGTTDDLMAYLCNLGGAQFDGLSSNPLPDALHSLGIRIPLPL